MDLKNVAAVATILLAGPALADSHTVNQLEDLEYVAIETGALASEGEFGPAISGALGMTIPLDDGGEEADRAWFNSIRLEGVGQYQKGVADGPTECRTGRTASSYRPPPERCKSEQESLYVVNLGLVAYPTVNLKGHLDGYAGGGIAAGIMSADGESGVAAMGLIGAGFRHPLGEVVVDIGYRGTVGITEVTLGGEEIEYESHGVALRIEF